MFYALIVEHKGLTVQQLFHKYDKGWLIIKVSLLWFWTYKNLNCSHVVIHTDYASIILRIMGH